MLGAQAPHGDDSRFTLKSERLGPIPLINHFLRWAGLEEPLDKHVPTTDARCALSHAKALGVLLRSVVVEREPIYRQAEMVQGFAGWLFGLKENELEHLSDDRIGRALDRLFDTDRAALLTDLVVAVGQRCGVRFESSITTPR